MVGTEGMVGKVGVGGIATADGTVKWTVIGTGIVGIAAGGAAVPRGATTRTEGASLFRRAASTTGPEARVPIAAARAPRTDPGEVVEGLRHRTGRAAATPGALHHISAAGPRGATAGRPVVADTAAPGPRGATAGLPGGPRLPRGRGRSVARRHGDGRRPRGSSGTERECPGTRVSRNASAASTRASYLISVELT